MSPFHRWGTASQSSRRPQAQSPDSSTAFILMPLAWPLPPAPAVAPEVSLWSQSWLGKQRPRLIDDLAPEPIAQLTCRPGPRLPPCILISQATGQRKEVAVSLLEKVGVEGSGEEARVPTHKAGLQEAI